MSAFALPNTAPSEVAVLYDSTLGSIDVFDTGTFSTAYKDLMVFVSLRSTEAVEEASGAFRFNADSGANYDRQTITVDNTTVAGGLGLAATEIAIIMLGASAQAGAFTVITMSVPNYAGTTAHKSLTWQLAAVEDTAASCRSQLGSGRWRSTATISRLQLFPASGSFAVGSRLTVYGVG